MLEGHQHEAYHLEKPNWVWHANHSNRTYQGFAVSPRIRVPFLRIPHSKLVSWQLIHGFIPEIGGQPFLWCLSIWVSVKNGYSKWSPSKWKQGLKPALPCCLILTRTHMSMFYWVVWWQGLRLSFSPAGSHRTRSPCCGSASSSNPNAALTSARRLWRAY